MVVDPLSPPAAPTERDVPRWLTPLIVLLGAGAIVAGLILTRTQQDTAVERDAARVEAGETRIEFVDFATQVRRACDSGDLEGQLCVAARQALTQPLESVDPPEDGRGIVNTSLVGDNLVILYSDGTTEEVGPVVGAAGARGPAGVGVVTFAITDGRLLVLYSDGRTQDVGQVVGSAGRDGEDGTDGTNGRGITDTEIIDGRLIIFYDDGTTEDAGPLPQTPAIQSVTREYADGTVERCTRSGGTDTDPVLDCEVISPASEPGPTSVPEEPEGT